VGRAEWGGQGVWGGGGGEEMRALAAKVVEREVVEREAVERSVVGG